MTRGGLIAILGLVAGCGGAAALGDAGASPDLSASVDAGIRQDLSAQDLSVGDLEIRCRYPILEMSAYLCNDDACHTRFSTMTNFIPPFDPFDTSTMVNVQAAENP